VIEFLLIAPLLLAATMFGILRWGRNALTVLIPLGIAVAAFTVWREPSLLAFSLMPAVIGGVVALTATEGLSTQWVLLVGGSVGAAVSVGGYYYQKFYLGIDSVRL